MNAYYFFPGKTPEAVDLEAEYAALAGSVGVPVPTLDQRITSVTFMHDGVEWVATVGSKLRGTTFEKRKIKGQVREVPKREYGAETVVAIFSGAPYKIWLDTKPLTDRQSIWANPIWASHNPTKVIHVEAPLLEHAAAAGSENEDKTGPEHGPA